MHFCQDELMALAAVVPGLVLFKRWLRDKWFAFRVWRKERQLQRKEKR